MDSRDRLLTLIQRLYAAPGTQDGWQAFLDQLCTAVDASCSHFIAVDRHGKAGLALTVRTDPAARAAYDRHWAALDPWGHSQRLQRAPTGSVLLDEEMQLHRRITQADALCGDLAETLDGSARAVVLVDRTARVTWMNRAAGLLTAARDGVVLEDGELRASTGTDTLRLRALLGEAVGTSNESGTVAGGTMVIGRGGLRRPLVATVAPLTRHSAFFSSDNQPAAVVILSDPDSHAIPDEPTLRDLLGRTPAEAWLVRLLSQGLTLDEAADRLGLRVATVRTRIKTIFEKTGTRRQAELVRLVLTATPKL